MIQTWFADFYKSLSVKKVVTLVIAFAMCVVLDLETGIGFFQLGFKGITLLILLACLGFIPLLAIASVFTPRARRILKYTVLIFLFFVIELYTAGFIGKWQVEQTKSELQKIVSALEIYRNETGLYPENLNELIPKYLPSIPNTKIGVIQNRNFLYHKSLAAERGTHYTIAFDIQSSDCRYTSDGNYYSYD